MELTRDDWRVITDMAQDINRIASALEVLAADVTERRERDMERWFISLRAEHHRLKDRLIELQWNEADERAIQSANDVLHSFEAAHPEVRETAVSRG